ncbi:hypothetical protein Tco_0610904 [Tanacetum coccineum]
MCWLSIKLTEAAVMVMIVTFHGNDSHNSRSGRRRERATRECTYSEFLKGQPLNFKGTEGVGNALTWWNSHVKTVSHEVKGTNVLSYNQCFQELALMRGRIFPEEPDEVEKYVGGLPDIIQGSVMASKPKTMQDEIEIENNLMDQKIRTIAEIQVENKRKLDNDNQAQQQPPKKKKVARAYSAGSSEKKEYVETLPSPATTNNQRTLTYYECGNQGHYRSDCPELKNQNHENQAGGAEARGMVYALGRGETDQDIDDMENDINA